MKSRREFLSGVGGGFAALLLPATAAAFGRRRRGCCLPAAEVTAPEPMLQRSLSGLTKICPQSCYAQVAFVCYYHCVVCPAGTPQVDASAICIDPSVLPVRCGSAADPLYCFLGVGPDGPASPPPVPAPAEKTGGKIIHAFDATDAFAEKGLPHYCPATGQVRNHTGNPYTESFAVYRHPDGSLRNLRLFKFTKNADKGYPASELYIGQEISPDEKLPGDSPVATPAWTCQKHHGWHKVKMGPNAYHVLLKG